MIYDYEVKSYNGEETLYLYFDFKSEFASLNESGKKKKLKEIIQSYIAENKINYAGQKIAIVVGGLIVATVAFNGYKNIIIKNDEIKYPQYSISVVDNNIEYKEEIKEVENNNEKVKVKTEQKVEQKNNNNSTANKNINVVKKPSTTSVNKNEQKVDNKSEIKDTATYVSIKRKNGAIEKIELEEYVVGVVGAEMPAAFHGEALKAQAVIARTYALNAIKNGKQLTDDSSTQNYKTNEELKKVWGNSYDTYYNKIKKAVSSTKGIYLDYNGEIVDAVYHSTSNGKTEDAKYVWGKSAPYLVSVDSPYDRDNKTFQSNKTFTYEELSNKFGVEVNNETVLEELSKTAGDRIERFLIGEKEYTGVEIRSILGLRSADFTIEKNEVEVKFTTKGYGHGVGLSQYGANGFAKNGYNFEQILKHYYKGVNLKKF